MGADHTLGQYTRLLRRHSGLVAAFVVLGLLVGGLAATAMRPTYTSTSRVLVLADVADQASVNATGGRTSGTINLDTEVQIAQSTAVANLARGILHSQTSPAGLLSHLTVTVPPNTTILELAYKAHSAAAAQAGAAAFAQAYLNQRKANSQAELTAQVNGIKAQLAAQEKVLQAQVAAVAAAPLGSTQKSIAHTQEGLTRQAIGSLNGQLSTLLAEFPNPGRVISGASTGKTGNPVQIVAVIAGLALGLLAGLSAPFILVRLSRKVRYGDDLRRLHLPVLAEVEPPKRGRPRRFGNELAMNKERGAQHAAAGILTTVGESGGAVLIAGLGSPTVIREAVNAIANSLRRLDVSVTVILPDLAAERGVGLQDVQESGLGTPLRAEAGSKTNLRVAVEAARRASDYVLLDGSRLTHDSEAYALAALSDVTVLVVEPGRTKRIELLRLVDALTVTGRPFIGGILWPAIGGILWPARDRKAAARTAAQADGTPVRARAAGSVPPLRDLDDDDAPKKNDDDRVVRGVRRSARSATDARR